MSKSSRQPRKQKEDKDIAVAKYSLRGAVIVATLGLIGTVLTAYLGYLSNRRQMIEIPRTPASTPITTSTFLSTTTPNVSPTVTWTNTSNFSSPIVSLETPPYEKDLHNGYFVIYPVCNCEYNLVSQYNTFLVRLRWGAKTSELSEKGADQISYLLVVDGKPVSDINEYRKPSIFVTNPILRSDVPESWWVYWEYPITSGQYGGTHSIEVEIRVLTEINNGWDSIPAGYFEKFRSTVDLTLIQLYPTRIP